MKQILRAILNWILFLTLPVWGGVFFVSAFLIDAYQQPANSRKVIRGEVWLIEI